MNSSATAFQRLSPGSEFWMCHQLTVTGFPPACDEVPVAASSADSSPPPHAASSNASAAASGRS
jgi:hypothetical protein